jgi:glucosamine 6-phosphate synthetase-like amidotransferase/phosphosugar isomerase protein
LDPDLAETITERLDARTESIREFPERSTLPVTLRFEENAVPLNLVTSGSHVADKPGFNVDIPRNATKSVTVCLAVRTDQRAIVGEE